MTSSDENLLYNLAKGVIRYHDYVLTHTCVFCGCNETAEEYEHDDECLYQKSVDWMQK